MAICFSLPLIRNHNDNDDGGDDKVFSPRYRSQGPESKMHDARFISECFGEAESILDHYDNLNADEASDDDQEDVYPLMEPTEDDTFQLHPDSPGTMPYTKPAASPDSVSQGKQTGEQTSKSHSQPGRACLQHIRMTSAVAACKGGDLGEDIDLDEDEIGYNYLSSYVPHAPLATVPQPLQPLAPSSLSNKFRAAMSPMVRSRSRPDVVLPPPTTPPKSELHQLRTQLHTHQRINEPRAMHPRSRAQAAVVTLEAPRSITEVNSSDQEANETQDTFNEDDMYDTISSSPFGRRSSGLLLNTALASQSPRPRLKSRGSDLDTLRKSSASITHKKRTTRTRFTTEEIEAMTISDATSCMLSYSAISFYLSKVRDGKLYRRLFTLPHDQSCLRWQSAKKRGTDSKILISQMDKVFTREELFAVDETLLEPLTPAQKDLTFCIRYQRTEQGKRQVETEAMTSPTACDTLILIADNANEYDIWVDALSQIIARSKQIFSYMQAGATMTKCRLRDTCQLRFNLSKCNSYLWWTSQQGHKRKQLPLSTVKFVRIGQVTPTFRMAKNVRQFEAWSFSLIYGEADRLETLDLIAHRQDDFHNWVSGLKMLIKGADDCQRAMQKGMAMTMIKPKGERECTIYLSGGMTHIAWEPSKKGNIAIATIKELRKGHKTSTFKARANEFPAAQCCSIIYGDSYKVLDLYFPVQEDLRDWITGLEDLLFDVQEQPRNLNLPTTQQLRDLFQRVAGHRKYMKSKQILRLLTELDPNYASSVNLERTRAFLDDHKQKVDEDAFVHLVQKLSTRAEIVAIMELYGFVDPITNTRGMGVAHLQQFLIEEQHVPPEEATAENCLEIIQQFEPSEDISADSKILDDDGVRRFGNRRRSTHMASPRRAKLALSEVGFTAFMMSEQGDAFSPIHEGIYMDMSQPLNHYFISSSHNTYLTADQIKGPSSVEAYIRCLLKGCRCVEIDCWDGPNGEPIIFHGHTLTGKIRFRDVILAINDYAFRSSPYPVIISVENHCCLKQQRFMADFMKMTFKDKLVATPLEDAFSMLPSPEDLKHKILIKCHKPMGLFHRKIIAAYNDEGGRDDGSNLPPTPGMEACLASLASKPLRSAARDAEAKSVPAEPFSGIDEEDDPEEDDAGSGATTEDQKDLTPLRAGRKRVIKMHADFTSLIIYTASTPCFQGFHHAQLFNRAWTMTSFAETRMATIAANPVLSQALVSMAAAQNTRTFPTGTRVNSTNFDPQQMWTSGCQMVALNWQTDGTAMQLHLGKFKANGACGYLLKPKYMRQRESMFHPHILHGGHLEQNTPEYLGVRVISGQYLPRSKIIRPYVVVELVGLPHDSATQRTECRSEGMAPWWNEHFGFNVLCPDLMLVRFIVKDYRGKLNSPGFVGEVTVPLVSLREGYRHLRLNSYTGEPLSATLFVHLSRQQKLLRSDEFLSKIPKPPVYTQREKMYQNIKLPSLGHRKLDRRAKEMSQVLRKALALHEKVLIFREKALDLQPQEASCHITSEGTVETTSKTPAQQRFSFVRESTRSRTNTKALPQSVTQEYVTAAATFVTKVHEFMAALDQDSDSLCWKGALQERKVLTKSQEQAWLSYLHVKARCQETVALCQDVQQIAKSLSSRAMAQQLGKQ
eukprot:m.219130 g.219130  ORF g.219130 m.219130 type:complete len:1629 (-) comp16997_c1_seq1:191-5077(-)